MTRQRPLIALAALSALVSPACAKDSYAYGPGPDWERYKAIGDAAIRAKLPDPDHWTVEWPNGYALAAWHRKFPGYLTCGTLRATSPVDGGYPLINFVAVIDHDQVQSLDISSKDRHSRINVICAAIVAQGKLPPASLMGGPKELAIAALGLTVRVMPDGAYVTAVAAGSPGSRAGIKPGTVITRANGIILAGLGSAMVKVLDGDVAVLSVETAAGEHAEMRRAP